MQRLYDYNINPIGYVDIDKSGKKTAYDTNFNVLGYYYSSQDKTYDNNLQIVGTGDLITSFYTPPKKS